MPLRIVGADLPDPPQGFVSPFKIDSVQDTTGQNIQKVDSAVSKGFDTLAQQTETVAKASSQVKQQESERLSQSGNGFFQLMTVAGQAFDKYQKIETARNDSQQKAYEKTQDEEFATATQNMQEAMFGLRQMVRKEGYEKGITNARERVTTVLKQHPDLTPEARRQLAKESYKQLDDLDYFFFKQSDEQMQDIKRQQVGTVEFDTRRKLATITARLEYGNEKPESVQALLDQAESEIANAAKSSNLDALQTATFHANMMKQVTSALENNAGAREQASARQSKATEWLRQVSIIANNDELAPDTKEALIAPINEYYGYGWNKRPISQFDVMKEAADTMQTRLQLQKLAEDNYLKNEDVAKLDEGLITEQALSLFNDPSLEWKYTRLETIDSKRVLERAKQFKESVPKVRQEQATLARMETEIGALTAELGMYEQYLGVDQLTLKKAGINVPDTNKINQMRTRLAGLQQQREIQSALVQNIAAPLYQQGLTMDATGRVFMDAGLLGKVNNAKKLIQEKQPQVNFSGGSSGSPIKPKPLMKSEAGYFVPFAPGTSAPMTSAYGNRTHPVTGEYKMHRGVDFGAPAGSPVGAIKQGKVIRAGWLDGYGNTVEVQHSDGKTSLYAHLSAINVKSGQPVGQGTVIGKVGNTGLVSGANLHFGVYGGAAESDSSDPVSYLRSVQLENTKVNPAGSVTRGLGLPPNQALTGTMAQKNGGVQTTTLTSSAGTGNSVMRAEDSMPQGAIGLPTGGYIWEGKVYLPSGLYEANQRSRSSIQLKTQSNGVSGEGQITKYRNSGKVSEQYNNARPIPNALASNSLKDYNGKNNPKANYGYRVLATDTQFASAIAGVADRLGFPAQWLVDVMAFETGGTFSPGISNAAGSGATGLIQFMPETAASLGTSTAALAGMTRTQQLRYVEKYFQQGIQEVGKFKRMDDVFAYIWGGGGLVRKPDSQRYGQGDGSISYQDYLSRIGEHAGRSYYTGLDRLDKSGRTHTSYTSGCPTCEAMKSSIGSIVPHKAGR